MSDANSILEKLNLKKITHDLSEWSKGLCPYSSDELHDLCYHRDDHISNSLKDEHTSFLASYNGLSNTEKEELREWIFSKLAIPTWSKGFGIRPEWTWKNFLSKQKEESTYLDVGPCHGLHSNIIYKEYYKCSFDCYAADILPVYLQLQTFFGIKTKFFDAQRMRLLDLYDPSSMDVVLFTEVLEHLSVEDGIKILLDLGKILRKDGQMMISFPVDARPFDNEPFGHIHQPDVNKVFSCLEESGVRKKDYVKLWSGKTYQHVLIVEKKD